MRIDPKVTTPPVTTEPRETTPRPATKPAVGGEAAVVQLSAAGTAATAEPKRNDITTRLQTIKAMIDKGDYPVDLDKLAERIVDDEFLREAAPARAQGGSRDGS